MVALLLLRCKRLSCALNAKRDNVSNDLGSYRQTVDDGISAAHIALFASRL